MSSSSSMQPSTMAVDNVNILGRLVSDRRCWQYWFIHLGPIVVIFIAFLLGTISADSCNFMLIEQTSADSELKELDMFDDNSHLLRSGLFRIGSANIAQECFTWQHYSSVVNYYNKQMGKALSGTPGPIVAAQVFAVLACLIGITIVILLFLGFYFNRFLTHRVFRIVFPAMLITAGFFQLLTFLIFAMDICGCSDSNIKSGECSTISTCSMLVAGRQSLCAALMYTGMGIGLIWYPKLSKPLLQGKNGREKGMYTSSEEADDLIEAGAVEVVSIDGKNRINVVDNKDDEEDGYADISNLPQIESGLDIYEKDSRSTSE